jgi:hypothetical protein
MKLFVLPINYLLEPVERINKDHFVCVFLSAVTSEETSGVLSVVG